MEPQQENVRKLHLDDISTEWNVIRDPARFVQRYVLAIQGYVAALVRNHHDAEEVVQDFFLRVTQHGFIRPSRGGRFRDYLKAAVRNAALNHLRRNRAPNAVDLDILQDYLVDKTQATTERVWASEWRKCLLERACRALEENQCQSRSNLSHTV